MHFLLYYAFETNKLSKADLQDLLNKAVEKNAKLNITGLLLYVDGAFIQLLEGEEDSIDNLFKEISADKRIIAIKKVTEGETVERHFNNWSMAFDEFDLSVIEKFENHPYGDVKTYLKSATPINIIKLMIRRKEGLHLLDM